MYEISVTGKFIASHQLRLPTGGHEPPHAHEWRVVVTFAGPSVNRDGLLLDFNDIKPRLDDLLAILHDRDLNSVPAFRNDPPSAENVARHIADQMGSLLPAGVRLKFVEIEEAPGCLARYYPT
jgi:6-pyruvoyltetrahydropterin/6-carboxytetrahydropterin synthase